MILAALLGSAFALSQPAEFALIPGVAGEARLAVANGRVETARYIGFTVGPFVGGVLAAAGGMRLAMLVNAATFLVVAGVAAVVRPRRREVEAGEHEPIGRARDGLVFLLREPTLAVVMTVAFVSLLFMSATVTAEVFFAKDVLEIGDVGYGALIGTWTLGMALGAVAVAPRVAAGLLASGALVAIAVQGLGIALPTIWLVPAFAFGWFLVGGVAHGTKNVLVRTLMHELVPARLHGRAFAAYNGLRNAAELVAMLVGGVLVAVIGARLTLFLAGTIPVVAALVASVVWADRLRARDGQELASAS